VGKPQTTQGSAPQHVKRTGNLFFSEFPRHISAKGILPPPRAAATLCIVTLYFNSSFNFSVAGWIFNLLSIFLRLAHGSVPGPFAELLAGLKLELFAGLNPSNHR